jgi:hypoxanthine-DNA glycosylase
MPVVQSFDPIIGTNPRVLILGSMPGVASLEAQQYYAHPRNGFWPIMARLFNVEWAEDYATRIEQLRQLPVILWDVLRSCRREGSLDADICSSEFEPNAIGDLLVKYDSLRLIAFNGATAEKFFRQQVAPSIPNLQRFELLRLPSTSPAHASKNLAQKLEDWRAIVRYCR